MAKDIEVSAGFNDLKLLNQEIEKSSKDFQTLVRNINPAYHAMETFEGKVRLAKKELDAGTISQKVFNQTLHEISKQANRAGVNLDKYGNFVSVNSKSTRQFQLQMQQAGYQVGDFFTQVAMGQNPIMAFSTQMSQLAGFFSGPWGAAIGAGISIVGALSIAFMNARGGAKDFDAQLKETTDTLSTYFDLLKDNNILFEDMFSRAEVSILRTSEAAKDLIALAKLDAFDSITEMSKSLADSVLSASLLKSELGDVGSLLGAKFGEVVAANLGGSIGTEVRDFYNLLVNLNEASTLDEQYAYATQLRDAFKESVDVSGEMTEEQRTFLRDLSLTIQKMELLGATTKEVSESAQSYYDRIQQTNQYMSRASGEYYQQLIEQNKAQTDLTNEIGAAAVEALKLAGVDIESGVDNAAKAAARLAASLGLSYQAALALTDPAIARTAGGQALQKYGSRAPSSGNVDSRFSANFDLPDWMTGRTTSTNVSGGGGKSPAQELEEYIDKIQKEASLRREQVGLSEEAARVLELEMQYKSRGIEVDSARVAQIVALEEETRKLTEAQEQAERQQEFYKDTILDGLESIIDGSKSVNEAFRDMLRNMLLDIYKQKVLTPIADAGSNFLMGLFGQANGGAWNKGVQMFANGGVVGSPTLFGHSGGLGVMGEAGPEAIMPLKRGADGKLGVVNNSSGSTQVHVTYNIVGNGDEFIMKKITQAAPQIAQLTQKQIMDNRRRGGQMKAVFN